MKKKSLFRTRKIIPIAWKLELTFLSNSLLTNYELLSFKNTLKIRGKSGLKEWIVLFDFIAFLMVLVLMKLFFPNEFAPTG